jgi:hypothetical protein
VHFLNFISVNTWRRSEKVGQGWKAFSIFAIRYSMADGLSAAASVVGIAVAAIQSARVLSISIDNIKNAPDTVKDIKVDLQAIEPVLRQLHTALRLDNHHILLSEEIKSALENCSGACEKFQASLEHWMKRSGDGRTFWMDRWRFGLFRQEKVKDLKRHLADSKSTLCIALSTANTYVRNYRKRYS